MRPSFVCAGLAAAVPCCVAPPIHAQTCSYGISPTSAKVSSFAGNGSFAVLTSQFCHSIADSHSSFIQVSYETRSGSGTRSISYAYAENKGPQRTGTIIVNENGSPLTFRLTQAGAFQKASRGDFNRDGYIDLVWRNRATGQNRFWYLRGIQNLENPAFASVSTSYDLGGVGDFNGEGAQDTVWRNPTTTATTIWYMNGTHVHFDADTTGANTAWDLVSIHDIDGDQKPDLLWRNRTTGENVGWKMDNALVVRGFSFPNANLTYAFGGSGDFNLDGREDLVWKNTSTGEIVVWYMDDRGGLIRSAGLGNLYPDRKIVAIGDYNGDIWPDIVFRNTTNGQNVIWYYSDSLFAGAADLAPEANLDWEIMGPR